MWFNHKRNWKTYITLKMKTPKEILIETIFPNTGVSEETELWFTCWSLGDNVIKAMENYKNQFDNEDKTKGKTQS